jgi:hypothetical protein
MQWGGPMGMVPFMGGGISLNGVSEAQLRQIASNTGVSYELLKAQQRAEMASAGSQGIDDADLVPTVEIKLKSNPKNPSKARRQNIKMLRKALRPPNYNLGLFKVYRYNAAHECACCGVDIRRFLEGDNAYAHITDERTGLSLADIYWFDEDTGQAKKPFARTHGDHGDEMNSTLCPAHLHIFHTLKSLVQEQELAEDGFSKIASKGTRFMKVPGMSALTRGSQPKNRSTVQSLQKYEPFFAMIHKDAEYSKGVSINQHPNPITGVADLVTVTFDLRALQIESEMLQQQTFQGALSATQMNNAVVPTVETAQPNTMS